MAQANKLFPRVMPNEQKFGEFFPEPSRQPCLHAGGVPLECGAKTFSFRRRAAGQFGKWKIAAADGTAENDALQEEAPRAADKENIPSSPHTHTHPSVRTWESSSVSRPWQRNPPVGPDNSRSTRRDLLFHTPKIGPTAG